MKTDVKKINDAKTEISVEVTGDIVKNKFEEVFKKIKEVAKVKGFRPGHVPPDILEKNFSNEAKEQVLKELIPEVYSQAIEKEGLAVIDLPEISEVKLEKELLSFKAAVDVMPEIEVKDYKGVKIKYKNISVTEDEIKRNLDALKESRKAEKIDDNFAKTLGYPDVAELSKAVERQLSLSKDNTQRQKIETEIIKQLADGLDFKLPASMVDKQLNDLLRQAKIDMALKGIGKDKIDQQQELLTKELEPQARNQVKIYLVLASIAKKENITQDEHMAHEVMEFLFKNADWQIETV